ncbi:MAG: bis(5'-nucleosyl)-tetraphosphatase [Candidatus Hodarchaeales archaeon]
MLSLRSRGSNHNWNPIISSGGVVFRLLERENEMRKEVEVEYLLLQHKNKNWGFPKGRREYGENDIQTAKREIFEETGLASSVRILKRLSNVIRFTVHRGKALLPKEVRLFLVKVSQDVQVKLSSEHLDYKWLSYEEALTNITYKSSQRMLKEADNWIKENSTLLHDDKLQNS